MWKTFLAGTTALAIAGGTLAYAQQKHRGAGGRVPARAALAPERRRHQRPSVMRVSPRLHAGLKLTAEQEKIWPPVESALRDLAKQRSERFAARASADRPTDPIER